MRSAEEQCRHDHPGRHTKDSQHIDGRRAREKDNEETVD
jgi:hypothetical protein